jgi:hypothetical protein
MTIIARKYLHLPTPNGDVKEVKLEVAGTKRGYIVLQGGHELTGIGPYRTKKAALVAARLQEGQGLSADVTIAHHRTPLTDVRVVVRDGGYIVYDGDIVVALFEDASEALDSVGLSLGQGLVPSMGKAFACQL